METAKQTNKQTENNKTMDNILYERSDQWGKDLVTQLGSGVVITQKLKTSTKPKSVVIDQELFNELGKFFNNQTNK